MSTCVLPSPSPSRYVLHARRVGPNGLARSKRVDLRPAHVRLDQYYTRLEVAAFLYAIFREHFDPTHFLMLEPSAGEGAFFRLFPPMSLGYDVEPKCPHVIQADFLDFEIPFHGNVATVGNPPFGKNSSMAVRFFNHSARQSRVVAMILPRTFRKASIENRLDSYFHLVREEPVPNNAFQFRSKLYHVPCVFQIWERRTEQRALRPLEITHPDFRFMTTKELASKSLPDLMIQRVGAKAGRIHFDFDRSPSSHYSIKLIKGDAERVMRELNLAGAAANTAGNPSLSKSEIVQLYRARTEPNLGV